MTTHDALLEQRLGIDIACEPLGPAVAEAVRGMTFPVYRHLLSLAPAVRHPDDGDTRLVQPFGIVARLAGRVVGLALAELPLAGDARPPELLSLFVAADARRRGVGRLLVAELERALAERGHERVDAVYMTGNINLEAAADRDDVTRSLGGTRNERVTSAADAARSEHATTSARANSGERALTSTATAPVNRAGNVAAIERIFAARGWEPPAMRTCTMRFTVDEAARMPWFGRGRLRASEFEWFAWTDLQPAERDDLIASHRARPWIFDGLEFWRHDAHGFDPVSSIGLRYRGEIVGWTINHRLSPDTTRISGAFVRGDLMRRGRLMALWTESITRMRADDVRWITSITPVQLAPMVEFLTRRCAPWATFFGETRGTHKPLRPAQLPDPRPQSLAPSP